MLTKQDNIEINQWFKDRGQYKVGSTLWDQHNNDLGKRLYRKLDFFIQACKWDWNKRYRIDVAECESLLYMGLAKALQFYGTKTIKRKTKHIEGKYVFTGKFKCQFSTYLTGVVKGILHTYLRKMNYKVPQQWESDSLTKKQFAKKFIGKKRQIPPHLMRSFNNVPINSTNNPKLKHTDAQDQLLDLQLGSEDDIEIRCEQEELLNHIYNQCSSFQQQVLDYLYDGWGQKEIADAMNVTPQAISGMLRRLRRNMNDTIYGKNNN